MKYTTLNQHDLQWIIRRIPEKVKSAMKKHPLSYIIGGGFIRAIIAGEQISDLDIFANTKEAADELVKELVGNGKKFETPNAVGVVIGGMPVQVIHRWTFDCSSAMLDHFDFTIAKACVYLTQTGTWMSLCHQDYYADVAAKRLVFTGSDEPGASLLRVLKFSRRGYNIPIRDLASVLGALSEQVEQGKEPWANRYSRKLIEVDPMNKATLEPAAAEEEVLA